MLVNINGYIIDISKVLYVTELFGASGTQRGYYSFRIKCWNNIQVIIDCHNYYKMHCLENGESAPMSIDEKEEYIRRAGEMSETLRQQFITLWKPNQKHIPTIQVKYNETTS